MFIFWGTKKTIRKAGYVADFCPICRDIKMFQLIRVGMASHIYGLSFGKGKLAGHDKICSDCGVDLQADPAIYKDILKRHDDMRIDDLVTATFPNILESYASRLTIEEQLSNDPVSVDANTRGSVIMEPFNLLAPVVEERFSATRIDRYVGITLLLTIVLMIIVAKVFKLLFPLNMDLKEQAVMVTFVVGILATFVQGFKSGGRYMRKEIYPKIVRSLQPIHPSQVELEAAFAELKRMDFKMSRKAKLKDLLHELA